MQRFFSSDMDFTAIKLITVNSLAYQVGLSRIRCLPEGCSLCLLSVVQLLLPRICRSEFVALHSENVLENLSDYLRDKFEYSNAELESLPEDKREEAKNFNQLLREFPQRAANKRQINPHILLFPSHPPHPIPSTPPRPLVVCYLFLYPLKVFYFRQPPTWHEFDSPDSFDPLDPLPLLLLLAPTLFCPISACFRKLLLPPPPLRGFLS
ncbi:unnamed protein product [Rodentolepis nana]|uniref:FH2 domain-containing protein n=1 Tax=Rodentolepis nana TaxID=102285 RepID=A0A0R3TYW2_RODNA|nr:unnamed protein product [Rodentolepis nana]